MSPTPSDTIGDCAHGPAGITKGLMSVHAITELVEAATGRLSDCPAVRLSG